jgi:hypothetical protein
VTHEVQPAEPAVSDKPKRHWYQFSLWSVFVLMTTLGIFMAWGVHEGGRRHRAIVRLQKVGASMAFRHSFNEGAYDDNGQPPGSQCLKQLFGEFYATRVDRIELASPERFTDVEAREVTVLAELDWLAISGSRITDRGLMDIAKVKQLGRLDIEKCNVSQGAVNQLRHALPHTNIFSDYD